MAKERLRCFWWDLNPIFPLARDALKRLSYQFDNRSTAAHSKVMTDKRRVGIPAIWRLGRDLNPLVLADFTDNPNSTARRNWATDGNRTHISQFPGCSIAVELRKHSEINDGQVVPQGGDLQAGLEPAPDLRPSALSWRAASPLRGG